MVHAVLDPKNGKKSERFWRDRCWFPERCWAIVFRVDFSYNYLLEKQIGHFFDTIKGTLYGFCQKKTDFWVNVSSKSQTSNSLFTLNFNSNQKKGMTCFCCIFFLLYKNVSDIFCSTLHSSGDTVHNTEADTRRTVADKKRLFKLGLT